MSDQKFTKGPWKVLNNLSYSDRKHHYQILTKDAGLWVANTEDCDSEEEEANAALIAAAPEMYVILEQLVEAVETLNAISLIKIKDKLIEDAVNIIKKARGEE